MGEYYAVTFNDDHLSHHGIYGQKWGVRRFQNPDGTLTEAGKKRYRTTSSSADDINDVFGLAVRERDVKKSIRRNEKGRAKEYSKIANNPENFLGLNKKHANKIDAYNKNIDAGKAEVESILAKMNSKKEQTQEAIDNWSHQAAKADGHGDGDDWKIYRSAQLGDEKAGEIIAEWKVEKARKTGKYDMEFLERELDIDQKTGEPLKGKALDDAYRKYLKAQRAYRYARED